MESPLESLHRYTAPAGGRLYLGTTGGGVALADPQQSALVLGPPRSGKTVGLAIPNVLSAPGAVVATSTKTDIVSATASVRARMGRCWLLDPSGSVPDLPGIDRIRWSPVAAARSWDEALVTARSMVGAARPAGRRGESAHWTERSEALLAPLLHAANLRGDGMETVQRWVLRQDLDTPAGALEANGVSLGADVLAGLEATDPREMSGIWSSTAGTLAAYRSEAVLDGSGPLNFDPASLVDGSDTVYVCAPARHQDLVAPIVVAFLDQARSGCYARWRSGATPLTFVLDELANIAPVPDLPSLVSEGGGQGLVVLGCLQDLSQARARWGDASAGFLSLFGSKVVLPGIADMETLELVSRLAGEIDVPAPSVSRGPWWGPGHGAETVTWSQHRQRRVPVEAVRSLAPGRALVLSGARPPASVRLPPWWSVRELDAGLASPGPPGRSISAC